MRRPQRLASLAFGVSALSAVALIVVYVQRPSTQWEGALLGVALAAFGVALVIVAHQLLPAGPSVDMREEFGADTREEDRVEESFERVDVVTRRRFLLLSAGSAVAAMLAVAVVPLRSLGPRPGNALARTAWRNGTRVVNESGDPVRAAEVARGSLVTVFPEGALDAADSVAVLVRVDPSQLRLPDHRAEGAPDGILVYSKVCTHAGCPVGLYESQRHELLCPCHQSAFDVLRGAQPTSGPAARALPQLPVEIDADGVLVARGDFSEPVGPSYWDMPR
jgi:ubiquinol-cytochrome c reductase iron-sulfur subunit